MRKIIAVIAALLPMKVMANPACPVCTIAVGAGLDIASRLGVPDIIPDIKTPPEWAVGIIVCFAFLC